MDDKVENENIEDKVDEKSEPLQVKVIEEKKEEELEPEQLQDKEWEPRLSEEEIKEFEDE